MPATTQLRAQGIDALKSQRFDDAADLLNSYLDAAPADREAELALAAARSGQGKHVAALTIFERHLEREPQSPSLHFNRGTTLERLGKKAEATKAYEQVLKLKSDHAKAQARLAALRGTPRPRVAAVEDIPEVIAVDGDAEQVDRGEELKARRRRKKGQWIHPGMLIGLLVYVVTVGVLAFVAMPAEKAGIYAGAAVLSSVFSWVDYRLFIAPAAASPAFQWPSDTSSSSSERWDWSTRVRRTCIIWSMGGN